MDALPEREADTGRPALLLVVVAGAQEQNQEEFHRPEPLGYLSVSTRPGVVK
jgi:hypothetical protein